jgi:2-haloacid dehalogenase
MPLHRRRFLALGASGALSGLALSGPLARSATAPTIRAIALDGLAVFDTRPISALTEEFFPGKGTELSNAWRTRQFEYTWLRTLTNRYVDFWQVTEDALLFAAKLLKLEVAGEKKTRLMQAFLTIKAWPDALPALISLKASGIRLALLSNFTAAMLDAAVKNSGLQGIFEPHLSTDMVRAYKPDPRAYQLGLDAFGLKREEIVFAAFGGWDAAGARTFGYPTFWVNRANLPLEELDSIPDATGTTLHDLASFVHS